MVACGVVPRWFGTYCQSLVLFNVKAESSSPGSVDCMPHFDGVVLQYFD